MPTQYKTTGQLISRFSRISRHIYVEGKLYKYKTTIFENRYVKVIYWCEVEKNYLVITLQNERVVDVVGIYSIKEVGLNDLHTLWPEVKKQKVS